MNVNIIKDLEAKASTAGLFSCHNIEVLDRRIHEWNRLMNTIPDELLEVALNDPVIFEILLLEPVVDAGDGIDYTLNDPQGNQ